MQFGVKNVDQDTANGTYLDDAPVRSQTPPPLDRPSEVSVGKALRLRLIPFSAATAADQEDVDVFDQLGAPDALWHAAKGMGLRSMTIHRGDNAGDEEKYIAMYRWLEIGHGGGNEVMLPQACPGRKCMRLIRRAGQFWLESRCEKDLVHAGNMHIGRGQACPLAAGMTFGCEKAQMQFSVFKQFGL